MIISHERKYIFLRVPKTASHSIEDVLWQEPGKADIIVPKIKKRNYKGMQSHASALEIKHRFPEEWNEYFKFAFVRNPWDRMVSVYCHINKNKIDWNDFSKARKNFSRWIEKTLTRRYISSKETLLQPLNMISINGEIAVDIVCRFEHLHMELKDICDRLDIPFNGDVPKRNHDMRKDKKHYSFWYSDGAREKVLKMYGKTIEMFGYEFEHAKK